MSNQSRRNFLKKTSLGAAAFSVAGFPENENRRNAKPGGSGREVWIASLTQDNMTGSTYQEVMKAALKKMELAVPFAPDIICLPEVFHVAGIPTGRPPLNVSSEDGTGNLIAPFQAFAKKHQCYVICPVYTVENGKYYNAAVVIDRKGQRIGEYRKARLTVGEIEKGLTPGPLDPPLFQTDFGVIGVQICYDIEWAHGWAELGRKGAEIVFWPSAFAAGKKVNAKAWENQYCVVSSTRKDTTKICDVTGDEVVASGHWSRWGVCAPVNLEKAFLHSWPDSNKFPAIQEKYGRKVRCYSLHEEEFSVVESLSPDVKVADIMKEFNLRTFRQELQEAEERQRQTRPRT